MKNGPIEYFAKNSVAAKLLMVSLILGGLIAGMQLPIRPLPKIDLRSIVITVDSPGSSPREIAEDINRRIEESLIGLDGVARVVSEASENLSLIEVELETFADANAVLADVSNAVDSIDNFPPASAEHPRVEIKKMNYEVVTLAISSSIHSENALNDIAEDIQNELLSLPSVSIVRPRGVRPREIAIEMNEEELRRYRLSIGEVART
ncbi:MAG: efflux RND transporter permease subunit, partial [Albidovulum sp.]|nr:efflux RND transporter permease subunit [Albidovulum sp.]